MSERIGSQRDAASTLFNLPGYRVIAVGEAESSAGRWVGLGIEDAPRCSIYGKKTLSEATAPVPDYARSTGRLREALVAAVNHATWTMPNDPGHDGWKSKMNKESLRRWY